MTGILISIVLTIVIIVVALYFNKNEVSNKPIEREKSNPTETKVKYRFEEEYDLADVDVSKLNDRQKKLLQEYLDKKEKAQDNIERLVANTKNKYKIRSFEIAGLYHRDYKAHEIAQYIDEGTTLDLVRQPRNKHDPFAVKIMFGDIHLGYVPAYYSETVSTDIKEGFDYIVKVIENDRAPIPRIDVQIIPKENRPLVDYL